MNNWKYVNQFYKIKDSKFEEPSIWIKGNKNDVMSYKLN